MMGKKAATVWAVSRQPPVQQEPPVQRIRLRYAKTGPARFTSHRDFGRAFERALRRAGIPMAYSSGFSPHPRISYANASPTGAATQAEYLEIGLAARLELSQVVTDLNAALPPGMEILAASESRESSLGDLLEASAWTIELGGVDPDLLESAVRAVLEASEVMVDRMTKSGLRTFDARPAIVTLTVQDGAVKLVSRQQTPLVRPDDVINAMSKLEPRFVCSSPPLLTRTAQGRLEGDRVVDPFD